MENIFLEIQSLVMKFKHLGYEETTYAKLYGKAPHIAPLAWTHSVFNPLNNHEVLLIKEEIHNLPQFYENFLKFYNGFSLYGSTLSFYGLRRNNTRDYDSVWQPYDLIDLNTFDKPNDSTDSIFFFGSYSWDGSYIYYDYDDYKIKRCTCDSIKPLNIWDDFESFLLTELVRIEKIFNEFGVKINDDAETIPNGVGNE